MTFIYKFRIFTRGMECFRAYSEICVNDPQRKIFENEVFGATNLYDLLCKDKNYQKGE